MGIKDLFENPKGTKILSSEDFDSDVRKVESVENIEAKFYEKRRFMPNTDFSEPKNFARYGLAKDYYVDSVDRILREYPYDGSEKEKTIFPKEWSVFRKIFNKKNISRKECLLLPFKALSKALKS